MPDDHELDLHGFLEVLADSPSSNPSPSSSPSKRASLLSRVSEDAGRRFTALSSLVSPGTTEEQLRAKFDEIDVDGNGSLSRQEVEAAFLQLGRSRAEVEHELNRWPLEDGVDFRTFRLMVKRPGSSTWLDLPGIGLKDGDLRDAFDVIDTDKSGQLMGREEIADALRELGKSQKQISRLVYDLPEDQFLDFEGFRQLAKGRSLASRFSWASRDTSGPERMTEALIELGRSQAEVELELRRWPCEDGVGFETFKLRA
ncbi:CML27 [Symbiodinium sp. KB8]|nr:CML27 [Symbiodinium sp. KB8]